MEYGKDSMITITSLNIDLVYYKFAAGNCDTAPANGLTLTRKMHVTPLNVNLIQRLLNQLSQKLVIVKYASQSEIDVHTTECHLHTSTHIVS